MSIINIYTDASCNQIEQVACYGYYIPEHSFVKVVILVPMNVPKNRYAITQEIRRIFLKDSFEDITLEILFDNFDRSYCTSTGLELKGFDLIKNDIPIEDLARTIIHTDCSALVRDSGEVEQEFGCKIVKEIGHGVTGIVNQDFKVIDKLTRRCVRITVKDVK